MSTDTWLRRVLFFGDSFVAGLGDPTALGWVGRVVATSFARGVPLTSYNVGVRLNTSLEVGDRWLAETRPRLLEGTRPRLVFSFGANDTTAAGDGTRVTPDGLSGSRCWSATRWATSRSIPRPRA